MCDLDRQIALGKLVSPQTGVPLTREGESLRTVDGNDAYPIVHGVPILLVDPAGIAAALGAQDAAMVREYEAPPPGRLRAWYQRLVAAPGNQRTRASHRAFEALLADLSAEVLCLSIGGGPRRIRPEFVNVNLAAFPNVDLVADAYELPYADGAADLLHCEAVFEHLEYPDRAAAEMFRVLRAGGRARTCARAGELWQAGHGDDPGLLNAARVLHLEASLRREQRRVHEALALLDQALAIDRWGETPSLLIGKARALDELGQHEAAIALLLRAESQLDRLREPRNLCVVRDLLARNLCHLRRYAEAELALAEARALATALGNQLDLLRVDWLRGTVAAGRGRTDEAIDALGRVRAAFMAQDNAYDTALVTLEAGRGLRRPRPHRRGQGASARVRAGLPAPRRPPRGPPGARPVSTRRRGGDGRRRAAAQHPHVPVPLAA
jgi:tetratricopeptide (TPR) repeat protein/uncharacterized protein YbaR (Trm112 family)